MKWILLCLAAAGISCTSVEQQMHESISVYGDTAVVTCSGGQQLRGELLCYDDEQIWIASSETEVYFVRYRDLEKLVVHGTELKAYMTPMIFAVMVPWTVMGVTGTIRTGKASYIASRIGIGAIIAGVPILVNELNMRPPEYLSDEVRDYEKLHANFRYHYPPNSQTKLRLLRQYGRSNPLPLCVSPRKPLGPGKN